MSQACWEINACSSILIAEAQVPVTKKARGLAYAQASRPHALRLHVPLYLEHSSACATVRGIQKHSYHKCGMALRVAMKRNTQTPSFALVQTQHRCLSCRLQQLEARRRHPTRHNIMQRHIIASAVPVPASSGSEKGIPAPIEGTVVLQRIQQQFDNRAAAYDQDNTYHPPLAQVRMCSVKLVLQSASARSWCSSQPAS